MLQIIIAIIAVVGGIYIIRKLSSKGPAETTQLEDEKTKKTSPVFAMLQKDKSRHQQMLKSRGYSPEEAEKLADSVNIHILRLSSVLLQSPYEHLAEEERDLWWMERLQRYLDQKEKEGTT